MTSKERPQPPDTFGFTERERLYYRVSDERFQQLLEDERCTVHSVELSANNYGEFLFVTVSVPEQACRPVGERKSVFTFWGLGLHEYRERWIHQHWCWYEAFSRPELLERTVDKVLAHQQLQERRDHISPYLDHQQQSKRGQLFELLAEMSDEDGAWAALEDLGETTDWLLADDPSVDTGNTEDQNHDLPRTKPMFDDQ